MSETNSVSGAYKVESANVGENVGVEIVDLKTGTVVGTASTWFSGVRNGRTHVHSRVDVQEGHQGKGLGKKLVSALISTLKKIGDVRHEVSFTNSGQKLDGQFRNVGYAESEESGEVLFKDY